MKKTNIKEMIKEELKNVISEQGVQSLAGLGLTDETEIKFLTWLYNLPQNTGGPFADETNYWNIGYDHAIKILNDYLKNIEKMEDPDSVERGRELANSILTAIKGMEGDIDSASSKGMPTHPRDESIIKEESQKRFVATMEFYVWAPSESEAKTSAEEVMTTVIHKYDNSASVTKLVAHQFGEFGTTENISEATKDEKLYELVGNLFELFGSMKHMADDFYEKLDADSSPLDILKSFADKKSRSIILRYFELNKKLNNIPIEEIKPYIERWMAEHEDAAQDIYSGTAASNLLKSMGK